jgi:hypothetical protein
VRRGRGEVGRGEVGTADSNQQASASERLVLQSSTAPTRPQVWTLEGRLAERADPSSPFCPLIGAIGKSGSVLMVHRQTVSNARVRCLQERRCADVRDGVRNEGREGEGEKRGEKRMAEEHKHRKNR